MTYLLAGAVVLSLLTLVACTSFVINIEARPQDDDPGAAVAVNIQTTDPFNLLGSQNVHSADKTARGDATSAGDSASQSATAVPSVTVPAP